MNPEHRLPTMRLDIFIDDEFIRTMSIDLAEGAIPGEAANDAVVIEPRRVSAPLPRDGRMRLALHLKSPEAMAKHGLAEVTTYHYDGTVQPPKFWVTNSRRVDRAENDPKPDEPRIVE